MHAALSTRPSILPARSMLAANNATRARQGPALAPAQPAVVAIPKAVSRLLPHKRSTVSTPSSSLVRKYGYGAPPAKPMGIKKFFDDGLLDELFPRPKTYFERAPKRRKGEGKGEVRGFAYTHGTRVDESGSEDDD